ncbi:MAG TPA: hypothetical protein VE173_16645, partial [Longimicrobiales bacterium]|nr:hypothetical protein [Longimicrobiales bacterium]
MDVVGLDPVLHETKAASPLLRRHGARRPDRIGESLHVVWIHHQRPLGELGGRSDQGAQHQHASSLHARSDDELPGREVPPLPEGGDQRHVRSPVECEPLDVHPRPEAVVDGHPSPKGEAPVDAAHGPFDLRLQALVRGTAPGVRDDHLDQGDAAAEAGVTIQGPLEARQLLENAPRIVQIIHGHQETLSPNPTPEGVGRPSHLRRRRPLTNLAPVHGHGKDARPGPPFPRALDGRAVRSPRSGRLEQSEAPEEVPAVPLGLEAEEVEAQQGADKLPGPWE